MRLDQFLFSLGKASSRTDAKGLITDGKVLVNGKSVTKPAFDVTEDDEVTLLDVSDRYVSRGGLKLECAMREFSFDVKDKLAIDIGASSGGFTDFLLRNGAKHVIAVDSGTNQLVSSLREDARVSVMENCNARYLEREQLEYTPNLAVMDVSFISATYIIPALYNVLADDSDFICLVKPQFEVGRSNIGKGGIVKDEKIRRSALTKVTEYAKSIGFTLVATTQSDVVGGDGNIEFLAHFKK
ncbi:MAG: TlyA family RNA methyltransferase [Clostridia bacterium]|nr:TlyA family RNA methyltransferase [Clostridia bacterium]